MGIQRLGVKGAGFGVQRRASAGYLRVGSGVWEQAAGVRFAGRVLQSAGTAGAVFLLLLEFIYTHHTRAAAELRK
jgi:hypothetical protein